MKKILTGVVGCAVGFSMLGLVAGCGSKGEVSSAAPLKLTGTFYGPEQAPTTGPKGTFVLGRSYVKLQNGVPQAVGFELTKAGRDSQPPTAITDEAPNVYFVALPAEASMTAFKQMAVFFFSGHPIDKFRPKGEPEHFHSVFLVNPPQQPSENFATELIAPVPDEIPSGISRGIPDTVVPGVGVSYDDPVKPAGVPARITVGQNYLYYGGHMNGMVVGTNLSNLQTGTTETDIIPQPKIYPRPGWYPGRWTIRYDASRNVNNFEVSEFVYASPAVSRKKDPQ